MSAAADTLRLPGASDRVDGDDSQCPPIEASVAARLVDGEPEPYPYTKIRDWIALLATCDLSDGAFRLYYISRSVIWENTKGGPPLKPVVEITYEEYAQIMGRSARTISRFADDLFTVGLWEELERASRSVRVPGKPRPQVQTVLTIRVHDYPAKARSFAGPKKTWDVLGAIREAKRRTVEGTSDGTGTASSAGQCAATDMSAQCDQRKQEQGVSAATSPTAEVPVADGVSAGQCDRTNMSAQSEQGPVSLGADEGHSQDHRQVPSAAETRERARRCGTTDLSEPPTNLSADDDVSAGETACQAALKKKGEEEKPSLPPSPSPPQHEPLVDELAMFSGPTVELVGQLYDKTITTPGLQPLSAADRAGLARRIEGRLAEGWSLSRLRAVLTGGSLAGVKIPGRLWAGRLDDMPAYRAHQGGADTGSRRSPAQTVLRGGRREASVVTNDCSAMPDPNAGKARYEVPEGRGVRMAVRWAEARRVSPWCGRCSSDTRCLRPTEPGSLLRPCPDCHPEPHAFPPDPGAGAPQDDLTTPPDDARQGRDGRPTAPRVRQRSQGAQRPVSVPAKEGHGS